jgi:hypothetical protein
MKYLTEQQFSVVLRFGKTTLYSFLGSYIALATSGAEINWGIIIASALLAGLGFSTDKAIRLSNESK